jgi:dTDP-4-dehydrorhamnose reductase (EC 1.1.1.133)
VLIHISTDFVFDGHSTRPYLEHDTPNPINYYGVTKYQAELEIKNALKRYFIIRTSWLYSEYGRNFLKTMLRLGDEKKELPIVNDQIGTPTYAGDLAQVIVKIINSDSNAYGIYHYSNKGQCSWFDFAKEIFAYTKNDIKINPIATHRYKRPAQRPGYSVLNKRKIEKGLDVKIPSWRKSLSLCINTKINET